MCALILACTLAAPSAVTSEDTNTVSRQDVQRLINGLGDKQFNVRNTAQTRITRMSDADPHAVLDECVRIYASTADPEIRFRLHEIMADIVVNRILHKPQGYLGIRIQLAQTSGPKGEPSYAIQAVNVLSASAAEQAGMKDGDMILKVDDLELNKNPSVQAFVWHVRSRKPADSAKLAVKRGNEFLDMEVKLGELPPDLRDSPADTDSARKEQFEEWLKERLDEEGRKAGRRDGMTVEEPAGPGK